VRVRLRRLLALVLRFGLRDFLVFVFFFNLRDLRPPGVGWGAAGPSALWSKGTVP